MSCILSLKRRRTRSGPAALIAIRGQTAGGTVGIAKGLTMAVPPTPDQLVAMLKHTTVTLVRRSGPDLSARQLAVFLTCYLMEGGHTVRGLAADLRVSKP